MSDPVNHPSHYKAPNGLETIDVIEAFDLDFRLGNAVKYILRAGKKNGGSTVAARIRMEAEDLKKARWYIEREIGRIERGIEVWEKFERSVERKAKRQARKGRRR